MARTFQILHGMATVTKISKEARLSTPPISDRNVGGNIDQKKLRRCYEANMFIAVQERERAFSCLRHSARGSGRSANPDANDAFISTSTTTKPNHVGDMGSISQAGHALRDWHLPHMIIIRWRKLLHS